MVSDKTMYYMFNALKRNWFKLAIAVCLFICVLGIYNFLDSAQTERVQNFLYQQQVTCINNVDKLSSRIPEVRKDFELIEAHFNSENHTCYAYVLDAGDISFYIVYDVMQAAEVQVMTMHHDEKLGWLYIPNAVNGLSIESPEDFDKVARKIMYAGEREKKM